MLRDTRQRPVFESLHSYANEGEFSTSAHDCTPAQRSYKELQWQRSCISGSIRDHSQSQPNSRLPTSTSGSDYSRMLHSTLVPAQHPNRPRVCKVSLLARAYRCQPALETHSCGLYPKKAANDPSVQHVIQNVKAIDARRFESMACNTSLL